MELIHVFYKLPMVKTDKKKVLPKDGQIFDIGEIKVVCLLVPGNPESNPDCRFILLVLFITTSQTKTFEFSPVNFKLPDFF